MRPCPYGTCWGRNNADQTGSGSGSAQHPTPTSLSGPGGLTSIATGRDHACAAVAGSADTFTDDVLYCWGSDGSGEVGDGLSGGTELVPVQVVGGLPLQGVSTGDEGAYCWGTNGSGQLGTGNTTGSDEPVRVVDP